MAINDNQKLDYLWKKLGYGVSKTDINSVKNATNESIPSPLLLRGDKLWAEASLIPAVIPTSDTTQVQLETSETTADATASANRTWKTNTTDWIPPEFGSTYQVKVYLDNSGAANPASTGTQLFAAGSGNNDEWFFDYQSGVLNFIGDNLPSGISGKTVYIVGARYIGNFGISGTTDGIVEGATNLYYTDERVDDRVANLFVDGKGLTKNYDDAGNLLNVEIDFTEFDTDDIVEGTVNTFLANRTTDDVAEGSNNLYYTDARIATYLTNNGYTTTSAVAAQIASVSSDLDDEIYDREQADLNLQSQIDNLVLNDLTDVNASSPTSGDALVWNGTSWVPQAPFSQADFDSAFAAKTTTDLTEGTNLYYTDARVRSHVEGQDLDLGSNKILFSNVYSALGDLPNASSYHGMFAHVHGTGKAYYAHAGNWVELANNSELPTSTDDVSEGSTNLYFTEERVDDRVAALIQAGEDISVVYDDVANTLTIALASSVDGLDLSNNSTDDLSEGSVNLYYTDARVDANIATKTTDDLSEGSTNLYYSDSRVNTFLGSGNAGNIITTGYIAGPASFTIDPAAVGDNTGTVIIAGNLQVDGTTTTINSTTVEVDDLNIVLGTGSVNAGAANGGGITIDLGTDGSATFTYNSTTDQFVSNKDITANITGQVSDISNHTTTDLAEGINLYYTQARFDTAFSAKTTTDLTEGTNLYYTQARFDTAFAAKDTDDLTEGSINLYYSDARVNTWATANLANVAFSGSYADLSNTPTDLSDFTDTTGLLDIAAITVGDVAPSNPNDGDLWFDSSELKTFIYYNDGTSSQWVEAAGDGGASVQSSSTAPSSPSDGDLWFNDNNLKLYIYYNDGSSAQWVEASGGIAQDTDAIPEGNNNLYFTDARFDTRFATKDTDDLVEGTTNLYYTDARVDARITAAALGTTDDLPEGSTNLYYTDARVQTKLGDVSGSIIPDTNIIYDLGSNTNRFRDIYLSGSSIYLGTLQLSDNNGALEVTASGSLVTETFATETYVDTAVANLVDSSPTTLDTLNELAAALGDDPNFSTTITNLIGTKLATADFNTTADSWLIGKTTTDLTEGTNLYYTDARVDARITLQTGANLSLANKTTDDLAEGSTNLYYSDPRVKTYLEAYDGSIDIQGHNQGIYVTDPNTNATNYVIKNNSGQPFIYGQKYLPYASQTDLELEANVGGKINVNAFRIYNLATPTDPSDAATKSYVDSAIATKDHLSELSGTTDDVTEGSTNLYYTDARVRSHVEGQDLDLGTNKVLFSNVYNQLSDLPLASSYHGMFAHVHGTGKAYYAHAGNWIELGNNSDIPTSTDSLAEGSTNLYYTDARVGSYLSTNNYATQTYVDNAILTKDTIAEMGDVDLTIAPTDGQALVWDNVNSKWVAGDSFSQSDFDSAFTAKDTDDLSEGSINLYYTDARVASYLSGNGYATTSYVTAQIAALSSDLDDEVYDREQADINLQSQIDSLTTNVGALILDDLGDVDTTTTAPTNGQTLIYNGTSFVPGTISGYTTADFNTDFATKTTSDLTEGTNLYYTDARADARVAAANIGILNDVNTVGISVGDFLLYDGSEFLSVDFATEVNTYADTRISLSSIQDLSDVDGVDTVASGDILLYDATNNHFGFINFGSEVNSYFDTRFATKSTTDLAEGNNLYYTDTRVQSYLTAQGIAAETLTSLAIAGNVLTYTDEDGITTNIDLSLYLDDTNLARLVSGTLNGTTGIATFTRDDATTFTIDFSPLFDDTNLSRINSATFTNGTLTLTRDDASTAATVSLDGRYLQDLSGLTTDNLSEGLTNLYYTQARFDSAFTAKSTTDLSEGTNLYYTDARADARIALASVDDLSDVDTTTTLPTDGQALVWDNTNSKWVPGASASSIDVSDIAPSSPSDGDLWFDSSELKTYIYYNDGTSSQWVEAAGNVASNVYLSDVAPSTPSEGDLWFNSSNLRLYVYYNDGTSSQWIEASGSVNSSTVASLDDLTDVDTTTTAPTNGQTLVFNGTNFVPGTISGYATSDFNIDFATKDTDDLTEGLTNLYYTDARVQTKLADVSGHIIPDTDVTYDLGSPTNKFRDLYLSGNSITLGGIVLTEHSGALQVHTTGGGTAQPFATISYVDTELANLVDSAPTTLDTLNELAAALGDDPNFATTITNLIGTKLATADFNTTADSWLTTKSTTNLSEGTNLYYTDVRVRTHVESQDLDLGTNKVLFSNMYANLVDLPSATSYHGMFAHVHATGKAYYAHAGSWVELANVSEVFDGTWASLTGTPTTISGYGITDAFDGDYNSLTNKPSIPSALDDLTDVDLTTTSPTDGQALIWDSVNSVWKPGDVASGGGGGASVSVSDTAPSSPSVGDLWFNSANTKMYVYFNDGTSSQWIQSNPSGATSPIISSDTAPTNPVVNSLWFDSSDGSLYFRYDDGSSEQWVNLIGASLSGGSGGASVTVSDTAPTSPSAGDMWFDSQYATLLIYYNDGTSSQWVSVSGENNSTSTPQWQEQSADYTASAGDKLFVDCSSSVVTVTLPSSPSQGDEIKIIDATGNASINNITINRNGSNIQGAADNLIIETDRAAFGLVYYNTTQGWLLMER